MKPSRLKFLLTKQEVVLFIIKWRGIIHFQERKMDLPKEEQRKEKISRALNARGRGGNGCQSTRIIRKLQKTYHVFKRNGVYKITHWFEMQSDFEGTLNT
jgi:hypothetical protein